jgi:hypothetical protein
MVATRGSLGDRKGLSKRDLGASFPVDFAPWPILKGRMATLITVHVGLSLKL